MGVNTTRRYDLISELDAIIFDTVLYAAKLSSGKTFMTKYFIHWKIFTLHQAVAIMYCTQELIQGENFHEKP